MNAGQGKKRTLWLYIKKINEDIATKTLYTKFKNVDLKMNTLVLIKPFILQDTEPTGGVSINVEPENIIYNNYDLNINDGNFSAKGDINTTTGYKINGDDITSDDITEGTTKKYSQWTKSDNDISYTAGKVSIGKIIKASGAIQGLSNGGCLQLYGKDDNHSIILRGTRDGSSSNETNIHQYGRINFWTNKTLNEQSMRMTILQNGNVGINNDDPAYQLDVVGDNKTTTGYKIDGNDITTDDIAVGTTRLYYSDSEQSKNRYSKPEKDVLDEDIEGNKKQPNCTPQIAYNTTLSQPPAYYQEKYYQPTINFNSDVEKNAYKAQLEQKPKPELELELEPEPEPESEPEPVLELEKKYPGLSDKQLYKAILKEELLLTGFNTSNKMTVFGAKNVTNLYEKLKNIDQNETMHFDFASSAGNDDTVINEVLYAPRNAASLIQGLEIRFNNQVVQNITDYIFLHNKLSDYTSQEDSIKRRNVAGENSNISSSFSSDANGYITGRARGFAHGAAGVVKTDRVDAKRMVVRSLIGFVTSNSVSVIDTGVVGNIQLRFFLASPSVLIKSDGVQSAAAATAPGGQAANKTYTLSNIELKITRMTFPSQYYESAASKLSSGIPTVMFFDDFQSFTGAMVSNTKTQQMRMTVSANSIKYLMGTFVLANREVIGACVVTDPRHDETLHSKFVAAKPQLLYNSSYFYSTGLGLTGSSWVIGSQRLPEPFNQP
ncbi:hypothetical protein T484DRAFT_1757282 [Baffinella frigidus]|nr:hypothetical protein T484DRAFT_1757282 [Cryptophyta sp. CCMP2293]